MKNMLFLLVFFASQSHAAGYLIKPKIQPIELKPYTTFNVQLAPDLGTRFTFPFVLDKQDDYVPFTLDGTNPIFKTTRHDGRNFFTVEIDPPEEGGKIPTYLGNLFVTVGGYNLTIVLSSTNKLKDHISDYVFKLSSEAREDIIQEAIMKRTEKLEADYKEKLAALNRKTSVVSLEQVGALALTSPSSENIKEEKTLRLKTGEEVNVYVSEVITYGNRFHIFKYYVKNDTANDLLVSDGAILTIDSTGIIQKLTSSNTINSRIKPGKEADGVLVTESPSIENTDLSIRISVLTSAGLVEVDW